MNYARERIGESDFLLPQSSEQILVDARGIEQRNVVSFRECRQYIGQSELKFDEPVPDSTPARPAPAQILLPENLRLDFNLTTDINPARSAVGDPVTAVLQSAVKYQGKVLAPKGAVAKGRLIRLEGRSPVYIAGIEMESLDFPGGHAPLQVRLAKLGSIPVALRTPGSRGGTVISQSGFSSIYLMEGTAAGSIFIIDENQVKLKHGTPMVWVTLPESDTEKQ